MNFRGLIASLLLLLIPFGICQTAEAMAQPVVSVSKPPVPPKTDVQSRDSDSCVNPGNPNGICWYEGWQFRKKSICIESGITGAPLAEVASMYRGIAGMAVYVRFTYGQCAAAGFGPDQRIVFSYFTQEDKDNSTACAYTQAANYGYLTGVYVRVNVLGGAAGMRTACGDTLDHEWQEVFAHEMGHAVGFTHSQPFIDSIMRDGHTTSNQDKAYLTNLYADNPL
jgi:hypothetical protein